MHTVDPSMVRTVRPPGRIDTPVLTRLQAPPAAERTRLTERLFDIRGSLSSLHSFHLQSGGRRSVLPYLSCQARAQVPSSESIPHASPQVLPNSSRRSRACNNMDA